MSRRLSLAQREAARTRRQEARDEARYLAEHHEMPDHAVESVLACPWCGDPIVADDVPPQVILLGRFTGLCTPCFNRSDVVLP